MILKLVETEKSPSAQTFLVHERAWDLFWALNSSNLVLSVADRFTVQNTIDRLQRVLEIDTERKA